MSTYITNVGETITDISLNVSGTVNNISAILESNNLTTWTPVLIPGTALNIPDGLELQDNVLAQMQFYKSSSDYTNRIISKIDEQMALLPTS